jgi:hypothetical protein
MKLRIRLNVRATRMYPNDFPEGEQVMIVPGVPDEIAWDDVFTACNRIESMNADLANLSQEWQQWVRKALDHLGFASMSVADVIECYRESDNELIVRMECRPAGWAALPLTPHPLG